MKKPIEVSYYYEKLETLPRDQLEMLQFKKLKYQLEFLYSHSKFYKNRFDKNKCTPDKIKKMEDLERIPIMRKEDVLKDQNENPPFGSRMCVTPDKLNQIWFSSGTSGLGREAFGVTRSDVDTAGSGWAQTYYRAGLRKGDSIAMTFPIGMDAAGMAGYYGAWKLGGQALSLGPYGTKAKLTQYMVPFQLNSFVATPSYLMQLTVACDELGIKPKDRMPSLKAIILATESFTISWAEKMEAFWNTRLHELYGAIQQGSVAGSTCEFGAVVDGKRGLLHLDENSTIFEFLEKDSQRKVGPGEEGEIVITNLHREGSPLVRFGMGDRATFFPYTHCSCGRNTHCLESGSIGRIDDMLKVKGVNIWPETIDAIIFDHDEVEEYNGKVTIGDGGKEKIIISVEFKQAVTLNEKEKMDLLRKVTNELKNRLEVGFTLQEVPKGTVKRYDFKTRRWTDERKSILK